MATLFLTKIIRCCEYYDVMDPIALDNDPPRILFSPAEAQSFNYAASPEVSDPSSLSRVRFANLCCRNWIGVSYPNVPCDRK